MYASRISGVHRSMISGSMPGIRYLARQFSARLSRSTMILPLYKTIIHFHRMPVRDTAAQVASTVVPSVQIVPASMPQPANLLDLVQHTFD